MKKTSCNAKHSTNYLLSLKVEGSDYIKSGIASLLLILLPLLQVWGQVNLIKGVVRDNTGKPFPAVSVKVLGRGPVVKTDNVGSFSLMAAAGDRLRFSAPGFYVCERVIHGREVQVQLFPRFLFLPQDKPVADSLFENSERVVEVLHGAQREEQVIQSIGRVKNSQLMTTPAAQLLQALPGRIAGLQVTFSNGMPGLDGAGAGFNIRGSTAQTVLIDGVERGYTSIDPDQIESITVLKDALSTVMFGQRSSNGIIAITTRKGDIGSPRISVTANAGISTPTALPKPLQAWQYATLFNEARQNDAAPGTTVTPLYSAEAIEAYKTGTNPYTYPNVDWYKTVLRKNSSFNRYNVNMQGSGRGFRYFVDVDYLKEGGLLKTADTNVYNTNVQLDRFIVRSNVGVDVTKTTLMQLNLFGRMQRINQPGGGTSAIFSALANTPANAYPVLNPDGSLGGTSQYGQNVSIYGQAVYRGYQYQDGRDMAVDLQLKQLLDFVVPGLYVRVQGSYNNSSTYTTARAKDFAVFQYDPGLHSYTQYGKFSEQSTSGTPNDRYRVTYLEAAAGYERVIGKHQAGILVLADQQSNLVYNTGNLPQNYTDFAARFTYNWDNRYLLEAAGSHAGFNYFAPPERWSDFWAMGLAWNAHNEKLIQALGWISRLKLRGSYGLTGFAKSGYYTYIQTYWTPNTNINNNDAYYFGQGGGIVRSTGENGLANPDLGPEKAYKLNLALDLGLFNSRLLFTGEYFRNRFFDLVGVPGRTSALLGTAFPVRNLQRFNYWGTDLSLTWQDHVKNFNYFFSGNFSLVQSKVIFNDEVPRPYDYQMGTGKQVGLQYGYIATGLFQNYEEINDPNTAVLASTPRSSLRPGDIRYLDRNGDGVIDNDDNGAIGNGKPVIYFGATAGFSYKGFDLSLLVQGSVNRVSYLGSDFFYGFANNGLNNAYKYNMDRWTPETASAATQPRLWIGSNVNNQQTSTFWIRSSDFIRLKSAEIGYSFPPVITRKIGFPSIRFFANGLNLLTWSELFRIRDDVDPEAWGGAYPIMRVVNFGVNAKF
ncbi:SusC/RagA family TonB-linked outer membrane protein [Chitinophaga tropicalis]|uniref:SusC/RagA family TonB-linked outer membrane protein n=1 Tax=Chitinophaga tropicalis TaxID=2683588 RepID=A0A7K1U352_9BACT|nr:SusC/RagA family TonB-linked outer membrane protein [Chitinophaga tropicalis]MVT08792.1 SusC/RagA family TonB-linked outer membrane protein [Chitinophaga tropicalis]